MCVFTQVASRLNYFILYPLCPCVSLRQTLTSLSVLCDQIYRFISILAILQILWRLFSWQNCQRFCRLFCDFLLKELLICNLIRLVKYEPLCLYFLLFEGSWYRSFEFSNLLWCRSFELLNLWRLFWSLVISLATFFAKDLVTPFLCHKYYKLSLNRRKKKRQQ
jgi:hypothetical protein